MICINKQDKCTKKRDKLLKLVFENPSMKFTIRGLAKKSGVSKTTVQKIINELQQNKIINKEKLFSNNLHAKFVKSTFFITKIYESGLIDYLINEMKPSCIILFGSFAKGEHVKESDIDLFIESAKKPAGLQKYEKKLGHSIQLFIETDIKKLPDELFNNVVNGTKLYGYFDIK